MYTYLHKSQPRPITLADPLDPALYDNIGASADDYARGCYIPLTPEQAAFAAEHPAASVAETLATALRQPSLEELRASKLADLEAYDASPAVNTFALNGASLWLDKATRVGLANSIAIEAAAGRTTTTLWFADTRYTLPIPEAQQALAALELYALDCYNTTAAHRAAILALDTPEAVAAYDYTHGYPQPLTLSLPCAAD